MLTLENPQTTVETIVTWLQQLFATQSKTKAVIAVSGGIDSAVSLTLVCRALGAGNVTALFLPYGEQNTDFGQQITTFNQITQVQTLDIQPIVDTTAQTLAVPTEDKMRIGNLKARARMLAVYDTAKKLDALVCGTENKSEHYLGYFTRFGDAASDIEPICHLYKTQVRQVASHLGLPQPIIDQAPSAGLWAGQTDEAEMGFTYQQADEVLWQLIDESKPADQIQGDPAVVAKVLQQVENMKFKLQVPYQLAE